jgi:hypothetical protein
MFLFCAVEFPGHAGSCGGIKLKKKQKSYTKFSYTHTQSRVISFLRILCFFVQIPHPKKSTTRIEYLVLPPVTTQYISRVRQSFSPHHEKSEPNRRKQDTGFFVVFSRARLEWERASRIEINTRRPIRFRPVSLSLSLSLAHVISPEQSDRAAVANARRV